MVGDEVFVVFCNKVCVDVLGCVGFYLIVVSDIMEYFNMVVLCGWSCIGDDVGMFYGFVC